MTITVGGSAPSPAQKLELQEAFNLLAGSWVEEGATIVAILGPDAQEYAVFVRQPDGSVQMQIVPRTGTIASLMSTAGSAGELASATDTGAIVKLSGTAGTEEIYWAQGSGLAVTNVAGSGSSVTQPTLNPQFPLHEVTKDAGVTSIANFGQISNGAVKGQTVHILNSTGLTTTLRPDGTTSQGSVATATLTQLIWSGSVWFRAGQWLVTNVGIAVGGGTASNVTAVALGGGVAGAAGARTFGGGTASGTDSTAFRGATATGNTSLAIKGTVSGNNAVGIGGAAAFLPSGMGLLINNYNGATAKPQEQAFLLARAVAEEVAEILTLDGAAPSSVNTLRASMFIGMASIRAQIKAFDVTTGARLAIFDKDILVSSDGTTMTLYGTYDLHTGEIGSFALDGAPTVTVAIGGTFSDLQISVETPAAYAVDAVASCVITGVY